MNTASATPRLFASLLGARLLFGFAYLVGSLRRWPTLWYDPLARRFLIAEQASALVNMEWYGRTFTALLISLIGFFIFWLILAQSHRSLSIPFLVGAAKAVGLLVLLDFIVFGWFLFKQAPSPLPFPSATCIP